MWVNVATGWQPLSILYLAVASFFLWILPVVVASAVGHHKGRLALGVVLGIFLGWIGVIIIAVIPPTRAERLRRERRR